MDSSDRIMGQEEMAAKYTNSGIEKRKRGRPKKNLDAPKKSNESLESPRKRGRPRKHPLDEKAQKVKGKRGRPKKYPDNSQPVEIKGVERNYTDPGVLIPIGRKEEPILEEPKENLNGMKYGIEAKFKDNEAVFKDKVTLKVQKRAEYEVDQAKHQFDDQGEMMGESIVQEPVVPVNNVKTPESGKKRGRPRKNSPAKVVEKIPKKRGRPKKTDVQNIQSNHLNGIGIEDFLIP